MSLFQCQTCGARENTACVPYRHDDILICSECNTGKWHGEFEKILLPIGEFKTGNNGNLEHIETGDVDIRKYQVNKAAK